MRLLISVLVALGLQTPGLPKFVDVHPGTVLDTDTQLVWVIDSSGPMTREAADQYVFRLQTGGYTDWRLPGEEELRELFDQQACRKLDGVAGNPNVCLTPTIDVMGVAVWVREGGVEAPMVFQFSDGTLKPADRTATAVVLPVRKTNYE